MKIKQFSAATFIVIVIIGFWSAAFTRQVSKINSRLPPEVQKIIDDFLNNSSGWSGPHFDRWKVYFGFDNSIRLSDVRAGKPIKVFWFAYDTLKLQHRRVHTFLKQDEDSPVSKLIVSSLAHPDSDDGEWYVPLTANGKIIVFGIIMKNDNYGRKWHWAGEMGKGRFAILWQRVTEKWPNSKGYNPVVIDMDPDVFLHVPEKDDHNLTYLSKAPNSIVTDTTYANLTSSKEVLKYLKTASQPLTNVH